MLKETIDWMTDLNITICFIISRQRRNTVSIYWWKMLVVDCKKENGVADEMSMETIKWRKRKLRGVVNIYKLFLVWSVVHTWPTFINTFTSAININIMYFAKCIFFQLTYRICGLFIRWFKLNLYVCIRYICNNYNDEWPVKISCNIINSFSWSTLTMDRFSIIATLVLLVITASSTCWFQTTSE